MFGYGFEFNRVNWTDAGDWKDSFDLGLGGDTILTYCLASNGSPHFIHGFSYTNGSWAEPGLAMEDYGTEHSALPEALAVNGSIALPYFQNYLFNGTTDFSSRKDDLIELFKSKKNYQGSNDMRFNVDELNEFSGSRGSVTIFASSVIVQSLAAVSISVVLLSLPIV